MSKKQYTTEEVKLLNQNIYVKNCTPKYITFEDKFKIEALRISNNWAIYCKDVYKYFWFPDFIINSNVPKETLKTWRFKLKNKWLQSFINTKKWRKQKDINWLSEFDKDQELEYLRAKVAYLEKIQDLIKSWLP